MSIRPCALESKAFQALKDVYDHRDNPAREWRRQGKKVLGVLGCDVPDELVMAAGMLPVHICADPDRPLTETDKYLEHAFDPLVRAQFEKLVDGTYGELVDYLAISNSTDIVIRVFLYLRELRRVEPQVPVPPLTFIDWLFTRHQVIQRHNEMTVGLFKAQLEEWIGREITREEMENAARVCNADRKALREMAALRHGPEPRISGSEALVIIGAGLFMEKEQHARLVRQVVEEAGSWPVLTGPRVYYTGANQEDTVLYGKLEELGLVVVGEDTDWGDRYYDRDYNLDYSPIRAIVDRYMLREFSAKKAFVPQRVEALDREVTAAGAQGVIFYTNKYDEVATWDMPNQRKMLEGKGLKHVTFGRMDWPVARNEALDEKLAAFAAEMKGGAQ